MNAFITGIGWVSTSGMGGGRDHNSFVPEDGKLPTLTGKMVYGKPFPHFGRLDLYSKTGIAAIAYSLKDAQLYEWNVKRNIGIVSSTTYGCFNTDIDYLDTMFPADGKFASPNLFVCTLPNTFLGEAAIQFGLTGPGFVVHDPQLTGITGLSMAMTNIALDTSPIMIAGICETGRPADISLKTESAPGALFLVLEKTPRNAALSYGEIVIHTRGNISFMGKPVSDLKSLAEACLETRTVTP